MKARMITFFAVLLLITGAAACRRAASVPEETMYTIGVAAYNPDSAEMQMFTAYYRDYLAEGFPVKFYFSGRITNAEEEQAFAREMKRAGAGGIISFFGNDPAPVVETCAEEGLYYLLGSGTLSDADFERIADNPYFLGTIGPAPEAERRAGAEMASWFAESGAKRLLILSGGAGSGNFMHAERVRGMLEALGAETALANTAETISAWADGCELTVVPGYFSREDGRAAIEAALAAGDFDAVLCACNIDTMLPLIAEREAALGHDIRTGTVDCFSAQNLALTEEADAFGGPQIDYVAGKYASMAGPAFAAMCNALDGSAEMLRPDGRAFRLYQGFWTAKSPEEYTELYGYTSGMYENAYSCDDLMKVIRAFEPDAGFEDPRALAEAYTVEDVKARILA